MRFKDGSFVHGSAALVAMVVAAWLPAACASAPAATSTASSSAGEGGGAASSTGQGAGKTASSTSASSGAGGTGGAAGSTTTTSGSTGGASSSVTTASSSSSSSSSASGNPNCNLPATVSFQKDVLPFLSKSCSGTGCHVIDATSTMAEGGYDHGYDWITGTSHSSSCPEMPTPFRFQVVLAVIAQADPPSCSKCGIMPPDNSGKAPLTPCDVAALEAWLAEPYVTQLHRPDGISPTTPYPMPPFN